LCVVDSLLRVDADDEQCQDIAPPRRLSERARARRRLAAWDGGAGAAGDAIRDCCQGDGRTSALEHSSLGCSAARGDVASSMLARGTASHSMSSNSSARTNVMLIRPLAPGPMLAASRSRSAIAALWPRLLSACAQTFFSVQKKEKKKLIIEK
jgi:hypothetical protein